MAFLRNKLALFAAIVFLACGAALSQVETGQIAGTVKDQAGAAIPGATINIKDVATNVERNSQSGSNGQYLVPGLTPGTYQITVNGTGFKAFVARVEVTVGGQVTLDAALSVSSNVTEVQVIGVGGTQVNTQSQELSQVVDTQQLAALPSLTRNPYDFVVLSGNVSNGDNTTNNANSGQNLSSRGVGYAINGQRQSGPSIQCRNRASLRTTSQRNTDEPPVAWST
ncbi:MAG TPA: carboxypeptidase-like regulatory domain-containing protein [Acidobacteriaceae bacterium]